jgi:hypothetical protein
MTVYYVAKTGNDSNAGTALSAPKLTIGNACGVADNGAANVVEVIDSGQYDEGDIEILSNSITVRATGTNAPILDGDDGNEDHAFETYTSGNVFLGLTFRNYDVSPINPYLTAGRDFILSGCLAYENGTQSTFTQKIGGGGNSVVQDCKFVSEGGPAFTVVTAGSYVLFNNCVIATNKPGTHAITSEQAYTRVTASFCTFIGSGKNDSNGRSYHLVNKVYKVINCIVTGSGDGINANQSTYNLVHVGGDAFITWTSDDYDGSSRSAGTGEITGDPKFVSGSDPGKTSTTTNGNLDFGTQDFSLSTSTPAHAAGIDYNGVTLDILEVTRADPPTLGAYEFTQIWTTETAEPRMRFDPDNLTINTYVNVRNNQKYRILKDPKQTPFSRAVKGPGSLRGRTRPYKVTSADDT